MLFNKLSSEITSYFPQYFWNIIFRYLVTTYRFIVTLTNKQAPQTVYTIIILTFRRWQSPFTKENIVFRCYLSGEIYRYGQYLCLSHEKIRICFMIRRQFEQCSVSKPLNIHCFIFFLCFTVKKVINNGACNVWHPIKVPLFYIGIMYHESCTL